MKQKRERERKRELAQSSERVNTEFVTCDAERDRLNEKETDSFGEPA